MPRKPTSSSPTPSGQLDFESVICSAQVLSREEVAARAGGADQVDPYSPVAETAAYMQRAIAFEEAWDKTIRRARESLLARDPRELYYDFILDLKRLVEEGTARSVRYASLLELVAVRGLGMSRGPGRLINIGAPIRGGTRWRVHLDTRAIRGHLESHVVGKYFLNELAVPHDIAWRGPSPVIAASDVSQHRSAVPVPARFFKRSVPFVLNNAAGALFRLSDCTPKYDNVFNPKPDEALLRWMLIDPSYQDELEPEDYERCVASAMDVGQYKFDLEYLLKADRLTPDILLRDGSLFPQDAYLDNYAIDSKRGTFTREAIKELLGCLTYAKEVGITYCGVAKGVQLKVYSALVDWFIAKTLDDKWDLGSYTLNDGQAMSLLLASPDFVGDNLDRVAATCLLRRSFTTRANLNTRAEITNLDAYFRDFQNAHQAFDITPFRRLCETAHVYTFFLGHSKTPQQQLPRYEFFHADGMGDPLAAAQRVLCSLQTCGLMNDSDHSFMSDAPVTYIMPAVTQQAHHLSKDVGKHIDRATGQWIMARYHSLVRHES